MSLVSFWHVITFRGCNERCNLLKIDLNEHTTMQSTVKEAHRSRSPTTNDNDEEEDEDRKIITIINNCEV